MREPRPARLEARPASAGIFCLLMAAAKGCAVLLVALALPARGEGPARDSTAQDSAAAALSRYVRVADSLRAALGSAPADSLAAGRPCVTAADRLCPDDHRALADFLDGQRGFALAIRGRLQSGTLLYADYAGYVLPQVREFLARENAFSESLAAHPAARRQFDAYLQYVQPLLADKFLSYAVAANTLLERKYFALGDEGNFLEGWLNGLLGFTRAEPDPSRADLKHFGVPPWEVPVRVEPLYLLKGADVQNFGGVLSAGLLHHFFPSVKVVDDEAGAVKIGESFASRYLEASGIKVGAGAHGEDFHWMAGLGLQVSSFSLWGMYTWEEERFDLALSLSDLDVVKALLPIFD